MIENENNKLTFVVGSSPVFPFPIRFFKKTDIHCYLWRDGKSIELQQNTDFTVETKDDYSNGANIELKTTGTINLPNGIPQEDGGFVIWMKRLEQGGFHIPQSADGRIELTSRELAAILSGIKPQRYYKRYSKKS